MPALGMAQETGRLTAWLKREGEAITAGEPLMEIETDKTTVEIEAPASGMLAAVTAVPGDQVPVAATIAWILAPGESLPSEAAALEPAAASPAASQPVAASPVAARMAAAHGLSLGDLAAAGKRVTKADVLARIEADANGLLGAQAASAARLPAASPKARRLAGERGLEVAAMAGSGPGGAILAADVLAALTAPAASSSGGPVAPTGQAWAVMAERLAEAWRTIPHFYLRREIDATALVAWRAAAQPRFEIKLTYTDLLIRVVAAALVEHPRLNGSWNGRELDLNPEINVGLAVPTDDGLLVPVIHQADQKHLAEIAAERQTIVGRARAGRLRLADLQGGTFTLSNLGMYGVDEFQAIVNPPQAAILAVGRIAERVVPVGGRPEIRPRLALSLSCDHRAVDGARAAAFLDALAGLLEQPLAMLQ
jgi:pyruvate dehydrogenase E2 component (dihydrolipoamide acetyltransferase)